MSKHAGTLLYGSAAWRAENHAMAIDRQQTRKSRHRHLRAQTDLVVTLPPVPVLPLGRLGQGPIVMPTMRRNQKDVSAALNAMTASIRDVTARVQATKNNNDD